MPYKKLSPQRLADLRGPRRKKPPVRRHAAERNLLLEREEPLFQALVEESHSRRALIRGLGLPRDAFSSWADFDQDWSITSLPPSALPEWEELSELMKFNLGMQAALEIGAYGFTAHIAPHFIEKWSGAGIDILGRMQKRLKRELSAAGLNELPYSYVVEGRSKTGRSRVRLHLHGYLASENAIEVTRFKQVLERALLGNRLERTGRQRAIKIERLVDNAKGNGYGRWSRYCAKYASHYDKRIKGRRVYMARTLTQGTREFWRLVRDDKLRPA